MFGQEEVEQQTHESQWATQEMPVALHHLDSNMLAPTLMCDQKVEYCKEEYSCQQVVSHRVARLTIFQLSRIENLNLLNHPSSVMDWFSEFGLTVVGFWQRMKFLSYKSHLRKAFTTKPRLQTPFDRGKVYKISNNVKG